MDTKELIAEQVRVTERVAGLAAELAQARERLTSLDKVLTGLRDLGMLDDGEMAEAGRPLPFPVPKTPTAEQFMRETPQADENDVDGDNSPRPARIRSTAMVADVINSQDGPMTREQVFETFELVHGFPDQWANPRNALGNALTRAHEHGYIDRFGDMFAPKGWLRRIEAEG